MADCRFVLQRQMLGLIVLAGLLAGVTSSAGDVLPTSGEKEAVVPKSLEADTTNTITVLPSLLPQEVPPLPPHPSEKQEGAIEVPDMLKDPYRNDTAAETANAHVADDTEKVVDPHVVDINKTHEEDADPHADVVAPPPAFADTTTHLPDAVDTTTRLADVVDTTAHQDTAAAVNDTTSTQLPTQPITDQPVSRVFYTESIVSPPVLALVVDHSQHDHLSLGKTSPFTQPTATAAILAGTLIGLAVAGYIGLVAWRKWLEKRYGNREMLVNEDDDLHHFEL